MQNGFDRVAILSGGTTFYKSMHYKQTTIKKDDNATNNDNHDGKNVDDGEVKILDCSGLQCPGPVSYTHLDVYKRQGHNFLCIKIQKTA